MSYKSKFEESEHRAHYQNIATKILREMTVLRSLVESSPIAPRRWVWELIQNAKDVHGNEGVKITIEHQPNINDPFVSFKHNGKPFTADNIRFLIEQISTKDRKKDEDGKRKTTGKFGTGFLTTHLLSEIVTVKGVAKEPELDYRKFQLELYRSGFEIEQITDAVQTAKIAVQDMDGSPTYSEYIEGNFNTEFLYPLTDSVSLKVAQSGLADLENCLPYTLAFVSEIKSLEILPNNKVYTNTTEEIFLGENCQIVSFYINEDTFIYEPNVFTLAIFTKGLTSIALPVNIENDKISLISINDQTPRLFCDFPLIGTEKFHFPVIINNPNFNPTDSRDGVFLTSPQRTNPLIEENKIIIKEAVELYFQLLDFAIENKWDKLHLLAQIRPISDTLDWIDTAFFKNEIMNPIRKKILYCPIVNNLNGTLVSILTPDGKNQTWFPNSDNKDIRVKIWELASFWFPYCLPQKTDIELWYKLTWNECGKLDVDQFAAFVEYTGSITELSKVIVNKDVYEWLNEFYSLLKLEEKEFDIIINKRAIFPNQNGDFCKTSHLNGDKGDIEPIFKDVLSLLDCDIRKELADEKIEIEFEPDNVKDLAFVVKKINSEITENVTDRQIAKKYNSAFKKLLIWFQDEPEKAKSLFPNLYKNKYLLYDDDEILNNITKADQLDDLLKDCNAKDIDELRELIAKGQSNINSLLPITQEILVSMGISSLEEWAEAIKDKNLADLFSHESTPTTDMFLYVQSLIKQAKDNIIEYLKTLPNYDLTFLDDSTAPTILAGVLKDGQEIYIVTRPAYAGEVIIYYGSERDVLDYEPSELWIDDSISPRKISLGHILKKANIVKFPI